MTIKDVVRKYNGVMHDANEFWPDGVIDPNERIVELPRDSVYPAFMQEMNNALDENNPVQYISDDIPNGKRFFLYYANAVL